LLRHRITRRVSARHGEADPSRARSRDRSDAAMRRGAVEGLRPDTHVRHGMRPLKGLISFDEAQRIAIDSVRPLRRTEAVPLSEALHRVAAEGVRPAIDVPLAGRSRMGGDAGLATDANEASETRPADAHRAL